MANILIVDDSSTALQTLENVLKSEGHQVTRAEDGMKGLMKAVGKDFDLVISDLNMPKMNGIEMTKRLRGERPALPIFLLTTEGRQEMAKQAKEAGATGWITKPFKLEQLKSAIAKVTG